MGLEQKIQEKAKSPQELQIPLYWGEMIPVDDVLAMLDEAAKQIQEMAFCQKWSDNEPSPCPLKKLQKCLDTEKPCVKAVLLVSLKEVLAILEGNGKEKAKP
jgi:hypothetical protein